MPRPTFRFLRLPAICLGAALWVAVFLSFTATDSTSADKVPGEAELKLVLKKLQSEKAPAVQGNTEEAKSLGKMFAMVMSMTAPKIPKQADKPEPRAGQRHYWHLDSSGERCAILIHQEGLDRLTPEKRDFFLGMCAGTADGAVARTPAVKELAVGVVWNGDIQWARVTKTDGSREDEKRFDKPGEAKAAMLQFFISAAGGD